MHVVDYYHRQENLVLGIITQIGQFISGLVGSFKKAVAIVAVAGTYLVDYAKVVCWMI